MADVTLTFDLNVRESFHHIPDQLAEQLADQLAERLVEHKVTILDLEAVNPEDLHGILSAAIDEVARLAHAAVNAEEEDHD